MLFTKPLSLKKKKTCRHSTNPLLALSLAPTLQSKIGAGIPNPKQTHPSTLQPMPYPNLSKSPGANKGNVKAAMERRKQEAAEAEAA